MRPPHITRDYNNDNLIQLTGFGSFNEAPAYYEGLPSGVGVCNVALLASMRPPHITRDYCRVERLGVVEREASMRPPHITRDYLRAENLNAKSLTASMRPPHITRDYTGLDLTSTTTPNGFNEAPAYYEGLQGPNTKSYCRGWASMRPPHITRDYPLVPGRIDVDGELQ